MLPLSSRGGGVKALKELFFAVSLGLIGKSIITQKQWRRYVPNWFLIMVPILDGGWNVMNGIPCIGRDAQHLVSRLIIVIDAAFELNT